MPIRRSLQATRASASTSRRAPGRRKRILAFAKGFRGLRSLDVQWFGGEPTLRFETMRRISKEINHLGIPWTASLGTNGYLLTTEVVAALAAMRIDFIQITLDGPAAVHDARRRLVGGGPTYERILRNIEGLLATWDGDLDLRVNVDLSNREEFFTIHRELIQRFAGKKLRIYPGIVYDPTFGLHNGGCMFDRDDVCRLQLDTYRRHGMDERRFYPESQFGCGATRKNSFLIGPQGEIYKCHLDIGNPERVIGNIDNDEPWNLGLLAAYMIGSDVFEDPACRDCFFVPLCNGGCAHARLKASSIQEHIHTCVEYKERLTEWLEIHYEMMQERAATSQATPEQLDRSADAPD
jgi:uncharacterized protein